MCRPTSNVVWCAFLLVIVYAAENPGNFTNRDEQEDTVQYEPHFNFTDARKRDESSTRDDKDSMRYEPHVNFTTARNRDENSMKDDKGSMQHEFYSNYAKDRHEESDRDAPAELRDTSKKTDDGGNFTMSHELRPGNSSNKEDNLKPINYGTAYMQICCVLGHPLFSDTCMSGFINYSFTIQQEVGQNDVFQFVVSDPCKHGRYAIKPVYDIQDDQDVYMILTNGTIYQPRLKVLTELETSCFAILKKDKYNLTICFEEKSEIVLEAEYVGWPYAVIVSLPFLLLTFLVYSILPELWNMHGYTLRGYVGSLFMAYISLSTFQLINPLILPKWICIGAAFFIHFSFMASFFWLNVMCFDIWWTFGGFRSLQGSVKQRERKKFIMYSIYAWGCASILTIVCAIMNFVPTEPDTFIKPEFGEGKCWYRTDEGKAIYFYGPMGLTIICNIYLFISTTLKIVRHKKDTAHDLKSSESRRHDDNKQWFILYLKLFLVMGISWSMEIISWLFKDVPPYFWYLSDLTNTLQGLIIFIIFVWKDKIKKLLLKRFGCQERGLFCRNSTRSGCHSTTSPTCTTTSEVSLEEKISPYVQTNCRTKNSFDETDCP